MKKITLLFLLIYSFTFPRSIFGLANVSKTLSNVCLKATPVPPDSLHVATLDGDVNTTDDVYIISCYNSAQDIKCTADKPLNENWTLGTQPEWYKDTNYPTNPVVTNQLAALGFKLQPEPVHFLLVKEGNPVKPVNKKIHVTVSGSTPVRENVRFYAVWQSNETPPVIQGLGGDQQGDLDFEKNLDKNCAAIAWDPYGRVFDSQSLEPIPGVEVTLLDKSKTKYKQIGITNPQTTSFDGAYSYFVANGDYYLQPSKVGYSFPLTKAEVHKNYTKAYSDLYYSQQVIREYNETIHLDIPLKSLGIPYRADPTLLSYGTTRIIESESMLIEGRVSHPLTIIVLYQNNKEIGRVSTDKMGIFSTTVNKSNLQGGHPIQLRFIKVNLTDNTEKEINIPVLTVEPLMSQLIGYAYSKDKSILPYATVNIKLKMTDGLYYQTKADKEGKFSIDSQHLPVFNYYLEFVTPAGAIANAKVTTSQFTAYQAIKNPSNSQIQKAQKSNIGLPTYTKTGENNNTDKKNESGRMILMLISVIVVLFILSGAILYLIKKRGYR